MTSQELPFLKMGVTYILGKPYVTHKSYHTLNIPFRRKLSKALLVHMYANISTMGNETFVY